jgi:protoheme IX farnesyltransferase
LLPVSVTPWVLGFAGAVYGASAIAAGATMILLAAQLNRSSRSVETRAAGRLFAFSIIYLFLLFASLLVDIAAIHAQTT